MWNVELRRLVSRFLGIAFAFASSPSIAQAQSEPSQFIEGKQLLNVYRQPNGAPYFTDWLISPEGGANTKRVFYVEANGKLSWSGTLFFDCDTSLQGEIVRITYSSESGLPGIYDPKLDLNEIEVEKWRSSEFLEDIVGAQRAEMMPYLPPYEVYVIARFLGCRVSRRNAG